METCRNADAVLPGFGESPGEDSLSLEFKSMATLTLKNIKKIYPFNGDDAKKAKKAKKKGEPEKKNNLQITDEGVVAVQEFNLEISSRPAIIRRVVDLPQPEGPTRTINSLSAISRLNS